MICKPIGPVEANVRILMSAYRPKADGVDGSRSRHLEHFPIILVHILS